MSEFYREAIIAACQVEGPPIDPNKIPNLAEWSVVAEVLNKLTPSQKCYAIYADWLLQLHRPGGADRIQIRDLLLGQGALAANYLAELAQNADDSGATALNVSIEDGWLFVANNGRSLTSLNLLGLCRFFVHSNGKVVGLTPETIGRFGIGFKSCHRVAEEVLVWTWDERSEWGFRLPICQSAGQFSMPKQGILDAIVNGLAQACSQIDSLRQVDQLGHCTPEPLGSEPDDVPFRLAERAREFKKANQNQGVWFALRLRECQRAETENRIREQLDSVYELCPLFLNSLRTVSVQNQSLRMTMGKPIGQPTLGITARRVTLEISNELNESRSDRFISLAPSVNPSWKVALHADSEFRIKKPAADRFSIRSGGAYAFFPLPALDWPWLLHLHIVAPTNLARSDWNPSERSVVSQHLGEAAAAISDWTVRNVENWHPTWQPCDILPMAADAHPQGSSQRIFAEALTEAISHMDAFRTLWGSLTQLESAIGLRLEPGENVSAAWQSLAQSVPVQLRQEYPLVLLDGAITNLKVRTLTTPQARNLFDAICEQSAASGTAFWQDYLTVVFGTDPVVREGYSRAEFIEESCRAVPLDRLNVRSISIEEAAQSRFAVKLIPEWHEFFRRLSANWLGANWALAGMSVFDANVRQMLRSLASPVEVPTGWDEVSRMTKVDFQNAGDLFWTTFKPPCPTDSAEAVIEAIWVECGREWLPLSEVWLGSEPIVMLKNIISPVSRRPQELDDSRRRRMFYALNRWDLSQSHEKVILKRLNDLAQSEFERRLREENPQRKDRLKMLILADNWNPSGLPPVMKETVLSAATLAVTAFCQESGFNILRGKTLLIGGVNMAEVLVWLPVFERAPEWLTTDAEVNWLAGHKILEKFGITPLLLGSANLETKARLGRELLLGYRHWPTTEFSGSQINALHQLFREATGNWIIGFAGSVEKRLNEHCVWTQPHTPSEAKTPEECILAAAEKRELSGGNFLPEALASVPAIRDKCFQVSQLNLEALLPDADQATHLVEAEIPEALAQNKWFQRLRQLCPQMSIVSLPGNQRVKWKRGEMELVIPKTAFGLCKLGDADVIFISDANRVATPDTGARYLPVLVAYTQVAPDDKLIASAVRHNRGLRKIYLDNRARIKARLVQAYATDMGYEAQHVMRELLQNAESAYASRRVDLHADKPTFEVTAKPDSQGDHWNVEITHFGRAFNEQDKAGADRSDDIERLCAINALQNRTPEEVGRFNRGFKSIFQVTDEVHVISGGYNFKVEDLLLLDPAEPTRSDENNDHWTRFSFKVNAEKKSGLFRETGGQENAFKSVELVFLRYVSLVEVKVSEQSESRFEIQRGEPQDGWHSVRIIENTGTQNAPSCFLVYQKRDDRGRRIAVAVRLDGNDHPIPMAEDLRFFYRTFPLQQKSTWFPFLLNSDDFLTDHGRAGLSPKSENETLIIHGLQMCVSLVRLKIENGEGNIEHWLLWVKILERRRLMDGASTLQTHRRDFEETINKFDAWLLNHLPDGAQLRASLGFVFPSRLLRRLHELSGWRTAFDIESTAWINQEVSDVLSDFGGFQGSTHTLERQIALLVTKGADKESMRSNLEKVSKLEFAQDIVSTQEIEKALGLVARHQVAQFRELLSLLPEDILSLDEEGEIGVGIETSDLEAGWNELEALEEFSLAGWMGKLVFDCDAPGAPQQQKSILENPETLKGKECWYRLLCLGSLLGARAVPQTVRGFWQRQLTSRNIFRATGDLELAKVLDEMSHQTFTDLDATGENAEMWRRVFYDFQKFRLFVFEDDLPGAFLDHLKHCEEWDAPINFLKNGFRKNESRWACSVGQSMTAPLFWIVRELRRIRVIDDELFDPSCYYLNGPARRALCRLSGFDESDLRVYRFEQLLDLSRRSHELLSSVFPNQFDLPLQWFSAKSR